MEENRSKCMEIKESLEQKQNKLNDVMIRIGPSEPFSDTIMNYLSGFKTYLEESDEGLPSDDDEPSEDKIKGIINNLVNRSFEDGDQGVDEVDEVDEGDEDDEDDEGDEGDEEMHHLKIEMDKALKLENEELENKASEQIGGTFASFF